MLESVKCQEEDLEDRVVEVNLEEEIKRIKNFLIREKNRKSPIVLTCKSLLSLSSKNRRIELKKRVKIFLIVIAVLLTAFTPGSGIQDVDTNAKIKAVFIYNFTKYIEWPNSHEDGEFTIAILGKNEALYKELNKMSQIKKVANQSFSIVSYQSVGDIKSPHILYIPSESTNSLVKAVDKLRGKSTLIVTEKEGMARKGSAINFVIVGNRQKFELNKSNVENHNLKVASTLENLAVLVN